MAQLTIIYDTLEPPLRMDNHDPSQIKVATLPVEDNLENKDIYEIARKLAELLLEQLA